MIVTEEYLKRRFVEFNERIFGGRLPACVLRTVSARTFRGNCRSKVRKLADGRRIHFDFVIQISTAFDLAPEEIDDTIIHEMIHYFIALHGLPDETAHGPIFRSLMDGINRAYGRNMRISHRSDDAVATTRRRRMAVVCVIEFADGRRGFKVLPRQPKTIVAYKNALSRNRDVRKMTFYVTDNEFFDSYPASGALRCYMIPDEAKFDEALAQSELIEL